MSLPTIDFIDKFNINDIYCYTMFNENKGIIYVTSIDWKPHGFAKVKFITYNVITNTNCVQARNHSEFITNIYKEL